VSQLFLGDQDDVHELLDLGITGLGVIQNLADKINMVLHLESVPYFFPLYN
jgi:hypothetical protein